MNEPMMDVLTAPLVFAMAQPGQAPQNIWVQLFPFAMMLLIFYLLVLMPMRKRQKKIQEFQSSLKVGDRVITTGGIYGQVTRVSDGSVQIQVADKVRIEVARAAIGGYQGQEPVVQQDNAGSRM
jgi:preprotein translocase subunit YajC